MQLLMQQVSSFLTDHFPFSLPSLLLLIFLIKWCFASPTTVKNLPPSPLKLPIIGNFHQLGTPAHRSLWSLAQCYGPLMLLQLGSMPTLVVSSSDAAREIMKTHDLSFVNKPESRKTRQLLYDMKDVILSPYGEHWRQLKSIFVLHLLSNKSVRSFRALREEETALLLKKITETSSTSAPVNLTDLFMTLSNDVVCRAAFGRKYSEGENGEKLRELLKEFAMFVGKYYIHDFFPKLGWLNRINGMDARVKKVSKGLDEFLEGVIEERAAQGENHDEHYQNFVDILLKIQKNESSIKSLDRDSIKALLLDAYVAGSETTTTALEWTMTELLRHPKHMKKVQDEVRGILNGKQDISEEEVGKMRYLKAVIKEALRLHPPIPLLAPRVAGRDVRVMGYDIAKGTMVLTNVYAIGRDPKLWDDPEEFHPERFLNSPVDFKGHDFQFIPFGAGRRGCPGISFAMAIDEFVLANLMDKFQWKLPNEEMGKELDMTESPGVLFRRKFPLQAVASVSAFAC